MKMQIPLKEFEQYTDEIILQRGLDYYENGQVNEPEELSLGVFNAIVEGTLDYTVEVNLHNENIVYFNCDCPYDLGPICKHIVAVLYYLREEIFKVKTKSSISKKSGKKKPTPQKNFTNQVNELLKKISHEELKQFIIEKVEHNPPFRNIFLSAFSYLNNQESKELYINQVKSILRNASARDGFIDWSAAHQVDSEVSELLDSAQNQYETKNYKSAIFICTAVMEQMTEALQYADDSNGDIGGSIERAFGILYNMAGEELTEEIRKQLFEYCLAAYESQIYSGWDWHMGMLEIAEEIFKTDKEAQQILTLTEKTQESEYKQEITQSIKYSILKKIKKEREAESFLEQNVSNPILRREALANAIKKKEYEKAISIAHDGINHDMKDKPGLAKEWYDWLLKIAQKQKDTEKIIEYSRFLFIDNFRHEQDYYKLLKQYVLPEKWNSFVEEMIKEIVGKKRWLDFDLIAGIYIEEQWWGRLLELIKKNPSLNVIENYERYLSKDYPSELVKLYSDAITEYLKNNIGRKHYQIICKFLRRIIKLGAREKSDELIACFRAEYPKRRALMEELDGV